jgi:protein involved in polysaccharide export with SLBB domain
MSPKTIVSTVLKAGFALALFGGLCAAAPSFAAAPDPAGADQGDGYQYKLGTGDKVQITTFGEPSLSGAFDVSGSGMVAIPLVGEVRARGLTTVQFGHAVEDVLRDGFLKDPKVSVEVMNYRPFYILGEVTKPGEYPYSNGLTVLNAVATANGFTYRADTHHVMIKRANEQGEHQVDLTTMTTVEPGDTIRIKERYF